MGVLRQMKQLELNLGPVADVPPSHSFETFIASHLSESPTGQIRLMESICEWSNMKRAIERVVKHKGAPGVDGMTVRRVKRYLWRHWDKIEKALLDGTYQPMPVRRKEIPKAGGVRLLGIPTVLDRVIQPRSESGIFDPAQSPGSSTGCGSSADPDLGLYLLTLQLRVSARLLSPWGDPPIP